MHNTLACISGYEWDHQPYPEGGVQLTLRLRFKLPPAALAALTVAVEEWAGSPIGRAFDLEIADPNEHAPA